MMSYYENEAEYTARGIDWDLGGCLEFNPQAFALSDIAGVLAVWQGENEGDDWRWILRLKDARLIFLIGGCDYTGWDCQSWASATVCETVADAVEAARPNTEVVVSLARQLTDGKAITWHEQTRKDLGLTPPRHRGGGEEGR